MKYTPSEQSAAELNIHEDLGWKKYEHLCSRKMMTKATDCRTQRGVLIEGYALLAGHNVVCAATLCDPPTTATTSSGVRKPTSPKRVMMDSTLSKGSGTRARGRRRDGFAHARRRTGCAELRGTVTRLTAPASWTLRKIIRQRNESGIGRLIIQVSWGHDVGVLEEEGAERVEDIIDTKVGGESELCLVEGSDRPVSASSTIFRR